jgi:hypothetical protein
VETLVEKTHIPEVIIKIPHIIYISI